jgi:polyisoprenoid-binding protein YceI
MRRVCVLFLLPLFLSLENWARADVLRFRLDPEASQISATIDDPFGNRVKGALRLSQGEARGDPDRLAETAAVSLVIEASGYNSNLGLRDQDVQESYLEVKQYPLIRFDGTAVVKSEHPRSSAEPWLITLKGELELHGVKREILVSIQLFHQADTIVAQGEFPLLLEEFKIAVPKLLFLKTGNKVQVEFRIAGERQPPCLSWSAASI